MQHTTYAWHAAWTHNWHTPYNIQDTTWTRIGRAHGTGYSAVGRYSLIGTRRRGTCPTMGPPLPSRMLPRARVFGEKWGGCVRQLA
jgi:hypothetical protein